MTDQTERALRLLGTGARPDAPDGGITAREMALMGDVFDELDVGLVAVDPAQDVATVNAAAATLLNLTPGHLTATDFAAVVADLAARALNSAEATALVDSIGSELRTHFKSTWAFAGSPTHLGVVSKPAPGFDGRIWAFYDNSFIAEAVTAAQEAEALIRASGDAMLDPQVILEAVQLDGQVAELVYRDVNSACCRYFGVSREQMIGRRLIDTALRDRYLHCAQTGEPVILDAYGFHSEIFGAQRFYDIRAHQVRPGMVALTWRDVTERIQSAQRVAASEEQFRLLAENVADVVVRLSDEGRIIWISNSVETALGAGPECWLGRHALEFATPDRSSGAKERLEKIINNQADIGRALVRAHDDSTHWIHLHSKPFYDAAGQRDGVVVSFRVIDDEVAAEEAAHDQIAARDAHNRGLTKYLQEQTSRLHSQLSSAARYVASILPDDLDGTVQVTSRYVPSEQLSGDTYDFQWIDDDHLVFHLVDVSGHGVEPALLSVSVHNVLRSGTVDRATLLNPGAVLTELNRIFQMDRQGGLYFTIWFGVYQASTRTLRFASAGHPPALVIVNDSEPHHLSTTSIPIGLQEEADFETRTWSVPPGADVLLYSDGALELGLADGEQWSTVQFADVCAATARHPGWTLDTLIADLRGSSNSAGPDDCTIVRLHIP